MFSLFFQLTKIRFIRSFEAELFQVTKIHFIRSFEAELFQVTKFHFICTFETEFFNRPRLPQNPPDLQYFSEHATVKSTS